MNLRIAIQPDKVTHRNGERQSFSERWSEQAKAEGVSIVPVDVFSDDVLSTIAGCDAFMWRSSPSAHPRLYAKRLLLAVEKGLGIPVFPSLKTAWHFEDKIAQHYLLSLADVPTPPTHVFWTRQQASAFCERASYPFVVKLASGYQAANVRLVHNRNDALFYISQMFDSGTVNFGYGPASRFRHLLRRLRTASEIVKGNHPHSPDGESEMHHGYFLAQDFLPGNEFDTRVTIIGNRAFAFRRLNRPDDFRASGSGRIDWDPANIDEDALRLAFTVSRRLDVQTVAIDVLRQGVAPVVVELTLTYASWAVRDCPGHWTLKGEPDTGELVWVEGSLEPADAIFTDFVAHVRHVQ